MLWKYFGLRTEAKAYVGETGDESKIDYLTMQVESLREQLATTSPQAERKDRLADELDHVVDFVSAKKPSNVHITRGERTSTGFVMHFRGPWDRKLRDSLRRDFELHFGVPLKLVRLSE